MYARSVLWRGYGGLSLHSHWYEAGSWCQMVQRLHSLKGVRVFRAAASKSLSLNDLSLRRLPGLKTAWEQGKALWNGGAGVTAAPGACAASTGCVGMVGSRIVRAMVLGGFQTS